MCGRQHDAAVLCECLQSSMQEDGTLPTRVPPTRKKKPRKQQAAQPEDTETAPARSRTRRKRRATEEETDQFTSMCKKIDTFFEMHPPLFKYCMVVMLQGLEWVDHSRCPKLMLGWNLRGNLISLTHNGKPDKLRIARRPAHTQEFAHDNRTEKVWLNDSLGRFGWGGIDVLDDVRVSGSKASVHTDDELIQGFCYELGTAVFLESVQNYARMRWAEVAGINKVELAAGLIMSKLSTHEYLRRAGFEGEAYVSVSSGGDRELFHVEVVTPPQRPNSCFAAANSAAVCNFSTCAAARTEDTPVAGEVITAAYDELTDDSDGGGVIDETLHSAGFELTVPDHFSESNVKRVLVTLASGGNASFGIGSPLSLQGAASMGMHPCFGHSQANMQRGYWVAQLVKALRMDAWIAEWRWLPDPERTNADDRSRADLIVTELERRDCSNIVVPKQSQRVKRWENAIQRHTLRQKDTTANAGLLIVGKYAPEWNEEASPVVLLRRFKTKSGKFVCADYGGVCQPKHESVLESACYNFVHKFFVLEDEKDEGDSVNRIAQTVAVLYERMMESELCGPIHSCDEIYAQFIVNAEDVVNAIRKSPLILRFETEGGARPAEEETITAVDILLEWLRETNHAKGVALLSPSKYLEDGQKTGTVMAKHIFTVAADRKNELKTTQCYLRGGHNNTMMVGAKGSIRASETAMNQWIVDDKFGSSSCPDASSEDAVPDEDYVCFVDTSVADLSVSDFYREKHLYSVVVKSPTGKFHTSAAIDTWPLSCLPALSMINPDTSAPTDETTDDPLLWLDKSAGQPVFVPGRFPDPTGVFNRFGVSICSPKSCYVELENAGFLLFDDLQHGGYVFELVDKHSIDSDPVVLRGVFDIRVNISNKQVRKFDVQNTVHVMIQKKERAAEVTSVDGNTGKFTAKVPGKPGCRGLPAIDDHDSHLSQLYAVKPQKVLEEKIQNTVFTIPLAAFEMPRKEEYASNVKDARNYLLRKTELLVALVVDVWVDGTGLRCTQPYDPKSPPEVDEFLFDRRIHLLKPEHMREVRLITTQEFDPNAATRFERIDQTPTLNELESYEMRFPEFQTGEEDQLVTWVNDVLVTQFQLGVGEIEDHLVFNIVGESKTANHYAIEEENVSYVYVVPSKCDTDSGKRLVLKLEYETSDSGDDDKVTSVKMFKYPTDGETCIPANLPAVPGFRNAKSDFEKVRILLKETYANTDSWFAFTETAVFSREEKVTEYTVIHGASSLRTQMKLPACTSTMHAILQKRGDPPVVTQPSWGHVYFPLLHELKEKTTDSEYAVMLVKDAKLLDGFETTANYVCMQSLITVYAKSNPNELLWLPNDVDSYLRIARLPSRNSLSARWLHKHIASTVSGDQADGATAASGKSPGVSKRKGKAKATDDAKETETDVQFLGFRREVDGTVIATAITKETQIIRGESQLKRGVMSNYEAKMEEAFAKRKDSPTKSPRKTASKSPIPRRNDAETAGSPRSTRASLRRDSKEASPSTPSPQVGRDSAQNTPDSGAGSNDATEPEAASLLVGAEFGQSVLEKAEESIDVLQRFIKHLKENKGAVAHPVAGGASGSAGESKEEKNEDGDEKKGTTAEVLPKPEQVVFSLERFMKPEDVANSRSSMGTVSRFLSLLEAPRPKAQPKPAPKKRPLDDVAGNIAGSPKPRRTRRDGGDRPDGDDTDENADSTAEADDMEDEDDAGRGSNVPNVHDDAEVLSDRDDEYHPNDDDEEDDEDEFEDD